jgi:hypothetical protein
MDVYLEGWREPADRDPQFFHCELALDDANSRAVNDLERTLAALSFATCVEEVIASAAPTLGNADAPMRAEDPMLTQRAPDTADQICILLTVRAGEYLTADQVLRCQADWQMEMFTVVQTHAAH